MKTNTLPRRPDEIRSYAQLQRQIHDALRVEHQSGLRPTVIVRRANLTNRALLSCSDFLRRKRIGRSPSYRTTKRTRNFGYEYRESCALASAKTRLALLARGDSTLVRHFQPVNWLNPR